MFDLLSKAHIKKRLLFTGMEQFLKAETVPPIALISGARNTGKTTLLAQLAKEHNKEFSVLYLNFRDNTVYSSAAEIHGNAEQAFIDFMCSPTHNLLLLDEITALDDYEVLCGRLYDTAGSETGQWRYKAFIYCRAGQNGMELSG